jgi:hypothetical protein
MRDEMEDYYSFDSLKWGFEIVLVGFLENPYGNNRDSK